MCFKKLFFVFIISILANKCFSETLIKQVGPNLDYPWGISKIDDENVLVTEKPGQLTIVNTSEGSITRIKDSPNVYYIDQGGLLDVYVEKRNSDIHVFLCFSKASEELFHSTVVLEKSILVGDKLENKEIIFTTKKPHKEALHFGCRIAVSDDYVYLSLGERGNRYNSQNINNYEGSIVRVKLDGTVIKKNPFNNNWLGEVYSIGHRNPQGLIIDKMTNKIWSHEHGPQGGDEINLIGAGGNYGWPKATHGEEYGGGKIGETSIDGFIDPKWVWTPSIAPSGMALYNGSMFPELNNHLLIGALRAKNIYAVKIDDKNLISEKKILQDVYGRIRDIEVMNDGSILFLTDEEKDGIYKGGLYKIYKSK